MVEQTKLQRNKKVRKIVLQLVLGGLVGYFSAVGVVWLIDIGVLGALNTSQEVALFIALLYVALGMLLGLGVLHPRTGARVLNVEDEGDLREQRRIMALSAVSMVVMGVLLVMLALAAPNGPVSQPVALAATVLGAIVLVWFSIRALADMDELMRAVTRDCGEIAYYLLMLIGGGWAVLAHLGYAANITMLDFVTLNFAALLVASYIANGRRGLLKTR